MRNAIVLHGLSGTLKSTICGMFRNDYNYDILGENYTPQISYYHNQAYNKDIDANALMLYRAAQYLTYLDVIDKFNNIVIHRSILDQYAFYQLFSDYSINDTPDLYYSLESNLLKDFNVLRILLINDNKEIIRQCLSDDKLRRLLYNNVDEYYESQDDYLEIITNLCPDVHIIRFTDADSVIPTVKNLIKNNIRES